MAPDSEHSEDQERASLLHIVRLGSWMVVLALRSTADLIDHPGTDRA